MAAQRNSHINRTAHPLSSHLLVLLQGTGMLLSCYPPALDEQNSGWLLSLCLVGAAFGLWALRANPIGNFSVYPEPRQAARLITEGPYRWVRHPMYLSLCLMMLGISLYNGQLHNALGLLLVALAVACKAVREEHLLLNSFGARYRSYQQRSWRLFPGVY